MVRKLEWVCSLQISPDHSHLDTGTKIRVPLLSMLPGKSTDSWLDYLCIGPVYTVMWCLSSWNHGQALALNGWGNH